MIVMLHRPTPRLSHHARMRCAEMGVSTKRAKRIVQAPDITRPSRGAIMAVSDADPEIAVLYVTDGDRPTILTVVWRSYEEYERGQERPPTPPGLSKSA